ncbi:MAG: LTA synthase family protein, partial [Actinobacteria bacterium]
FALATYSAVDLFFPDMRFRAAIIADATISTLLLAVVVYATYYEVLPTRAGLAAIGQAATVSVSIASLARPVYLLLFLDIPLLVWWVVRSRRRGVDPITGRRPGVVAVQGLRTPYVYQRRAVYVAALCAVIVFASVTGDVRSGLDLRDGKAVTKTRGLASYLVAGAIGPLPTDEGTGPLSPLQVQLEVDALRGETTNARVAGFTSGSAKGANVIVIQVEALQAAAIGAKVGGTSITPNLDRLISRSWYFPNHFSGIGRGTTSDAEFVTNTSLYPPPDGAAALMYSDRELTSLPRLLAKEGYGSYTFHTNTAAYWNRSQLYPALGFTRYYDKAFFGDAEKIAFGASDRILFSKAGQKLDALNRSGRPFYAMLVTMSSHFPFTEIPANERKVPLVPPYAGTIEGDYLTEINYADRQIGRFVDDLERSGALQNTVLVIYGDHFGLPEARSAGEVAALEALLGHDYTQADRLNTPLIVHLPGQSRAGVVQRPVGQIDIMPTIADALGLDMSSTPHFGVSAFTTGGTLFSAGGLLPAGAYVDQSVVYAPGDTLAQGQTWDVSTRSPVDAPSQRVSQASRVRRLLSDSRAYVESLPQRADYDPNAKVVLPSE